jgi:pimeloyl-ACP methyl ester carboxylesterase
MVEKSKEKKQNSREEQHPKKIEKLLQENEFPLTEQQLNNINQLIDNYRRTDQPLFFEDLETEIDYVPIEDGKLRFFHHKPKKTILKRPIIFLPGFGSTPEVWFWFHKTHHNLGEYYYLETREKGPCPIKRSRKIDFTMDQFAKDLGQAVDYFNIPNNDFVLFGASFSGGIVLQALTQGYLPKSITPIAFDPVTKWVYTKKKGNLFLLTTPAFVLGVLKILIGKIVMFSMKNEAQKKRNEQFLKQADTFKWRQTILQNRKFDVFPQLKDINQPAYIFHGPKDKYHEGKAFLDAAKAIPDGRFFYMHCIEEDRELLAGIIATLFANEKKPQKVPETLREFEIKK